MLKHASTEAFRAKFRAQKYVARDEVTCETLFRRMLDAELSWRYRLADWPRIAMACDRSPGRCEEPVAYELLLLDSHNAAVRDEHARTELQIEAGRADAQRRHVGQQVAAIGQVLGALDVVTHRGPSCRSYPSAFAGRMAITVCTE